MRVKAKKINIKLKKLLPYLPVTLVGKKNMLRVKTVIGVFL